MSAYGLSCAPGTVDRALGDRRESSFSSRAVGALRRPARACRRSPRSSAQSASAIAAGPRRRRRSRRLHADPPRGELVAVLRACRWTAPSSARPSACPRRRSAASNAWTARTAAPQRRARTAASGCSRSTPPPTRHPPPPVRSGSSTPRVRTERTTTRPWVVRPGCSSSVPKRRCSPSNTGPAPSRSSCPSHPLPPGSTPASMLVDLARRVLPTMPGVALSPTPTPTAPPGPRAGNGLIGRR